MCGYDITTNMAEIRNRYHHTRARAHTHTSDAACPWLFNSEALEAERHRGITKTDGVERRYCGSLGVCPQFDILWPNLTVTEHAEVFAAFQGVPREAMTTEVATLVHDVGLAEKRNALTMTLSGGQKRKLSVVLAFMGRPKVVFLDEPTSGMDPHSRRMTWDIIRKYKNGRAIVLTTHFMDEVSGTDGAVRFWCCCSFVGTTQLSPASFNV